MRTKPAARSILARECLLAVVGAAFVLTSAGCLVASDVQDELISVDSERLAIGNAEDALIKADHPDKNYGSLDYLRARQGHSMTFLRFVVDTGAQEIESASLRLYVTDGSPDGGSLFAVSSSWNEEEITWNNAPAISGDPLAELGSVSEGSWVVVDLTGVVRQSGAFSFAIRSSNSNSIFYSSREGPFPPELNLEVAAADAPCGSCEADEILAVVADAQVKQRYSDRNYGTQSGLRARSGSYVSYIAFDIPQAISEIERVALRLFVTDGSPDGGAVIPTSTDWLEEQITWDNAPMHNAAPLTQLGAVDRDTWVEVDLSTLVTGPGRYSVALVSSASNSVFYSSREGGNAPVIALTVAAGQQQSQCGDGVCAADESCDGCPADCGECLDACGDAVCAADESCGSCAEDCGACTASGGIWISQDEIQRLPTSGSAWNNLLGDAQKATNSADLGNQDDKTDTNTLAKALVYARTGENRYAQEVRSSLQNLVEGNSISNSLAWDSLGALRSLGSYAMAADLIDLASYDPDFDTNTFRPWLGAARHGDTEGGRGTLNELHEKRPNNWGTHASASRIAIDLYLGDEADLDRAAQVFKGYLGDRSAYDGFTYGELSWQADASRPVGINPKGATKNGHSIDGVLPDDQRRCSTSFAWPACKTGYQWEGLQGVVASAHMLNRAGYAAFEWEDRAILRAIEWLHDTTFSDGKNNPAEGDDVWQIWIINDYYGSSFPKSSGVSPGKMVGYADWTHQ